MAKTPPETAVFVAAGADEAGVTAGVVEGAATEALPVAAGAATPAM